MQVRITACAGECPFPGGSVRTLSWISRVFAAGAAVAAMALVVGGSYYVGFVGEVQRGLNDPQSASAQAIGRISAIEQALGYQGYLRAYRTFRLTGDMTARQQLSQRSMEAARTLDGLRGLFAASPAATLAIRDVEAVVEEFARIARSAPETPATALRGSASMEAIDSMPAVPQLEATYLTLRSGLDRLRAQTSSYQMGSIAWALTWSQMLIICAFAAIICGLVAAASLLQIGITQPLKSLAQSLKGAAEGRLASPIWGTERADEIGEMARASEQLRKSLTETEALQQLARNGHLSIRIEGEASALLDRTVGEVVANVQQAADALRQAAGELHETQAAQREVIGTQKAAVGTFGEKLEDMAAGFSRAAWGAVETAADDIRKATSRIAETAATRDTELTDVTRRLEERGREMSDAFDGIRARTGTAIDGLTGAIAAFGKAAESTGTIQGALFASCDRISSDAAATSDTIRTLADRLGEVITTAETRLTTPPQAVPAAVQEQDDMAAILRLFDDEQTGPSGETDGTLRDQLVDRIASALRDRLTPDEALRREVEAMRSDIRELALRMTEERILMTAEMPASALAAEAPILSPSPQRTLADVPAHEILERLRRLSDEMSAPQASTPEPANDSADDEATSRPPSLTDNLKAFALSVKPLASAPETASDMRVMAGDFARHAEAIALSAREVAHAAALRAELDAITSGLRDLATSLQAPDAEPAEGLQETAIDLAARAETLFSYLNQRKVAASHEATVETAPEAGGTETITRATQDLMALARIIGSLEQRTALLSDAAVAANIARQTADADASQADGADGPAAQQTEQAISVVYEAVERLNNIAAALARAADASHQRRAASA